MLLYFKLFKTKIIVTVFTLLLLCWTIVASVIALRKDTEFAIVYATPEKVELLLERNSETDAIFFRNFLFAYVGYCYNYNLKTFHQNISKCGDLMSAELWNKKQDDIGYTINALTKEKYTLVTTLIDDPQVLTNGNIELIIRSDKIAADGPANLKIRVIMSIHKVELTKENTFGWEVTSVKEDVI